MDGTKKSNRSTKAQSTWPQCIEQNTVIRGAGKSLFTNVAGFGAAAGCYQDDCLRGETKGSTIQGKMEIEWDSRDGPNAHQPTARRYDFPLERRLGGP